MDKKYIDLFKTLAQATAASAEQVMDYDREKGDEDGLKAATIMRDDFQDLVSRIDVTEYVLTKADATKFLLGSMIQVNQLQDRINNLKKAMAGYQTDIIPKLQRIVDAEDDEAAQKIANEEFIIKEEQVNI